MIRSIRTVAIATALCATCLRAAATLPVTEGTAPDCSGASASIGVIWPPNHSMVPITIVGVTPANDSTLTIAIKSIYQDEMVNSIGSGNTAPDGDGIGTDTALVRAERSGPGTGRLYFITFTATNSVGQCTGTVNPYVPHDQGQGYMPVDTGLRTDSTVIPN